MRLLARVRIVTGATTHSVQASRFSEFRPATRVEVVSDDSGFLLIRYAADEFAGDTWHATVDGAKRQAELEYAIAEADWSEACAAVPELEVAPGNGELVGTIWALVAAFTPPPSSLPTAPLAA